MSTEYNFDIPNLYVILGISCSSIVETIIIEGYNISDPHYYILENYSKIETKYPFIYQIIVNLISIYKKQCKTDPNITNLKNLFDISNEFGQNFIKIIECEQKNNINACSYYQNNKKTIQLKSSQPKVENKNETKIEIKIKMLNTEHLVNNTTQPETLITSKIPTESTKNTVKPKIAIKMKGNA